MLNVFFLSLVEKIKKVLDMNNHMKTPFIKATNKVHIGVIII